MAETKAAAENTTGDKKSDDVKADEGKKANGDQSLEEVGNELDNTLIYDDEGDQEEEGVGAEIPEDKLTEEDKQNFFESDKNPIVRITGLKKPNSIKHNFDEWVKFFEEKVNVSQLPVIQNPSVDDVFLSFKFKTFEDKKKLYEAAKKFKTPPGVKRIQIKASFFERNKVLKTMKVTKELTQDEALDILYPKRNMLYADQLQEKTDIMKAMVEEKLIPLKEIEKLPGNRKYLKNVKVRNLIPLTPIDGYENHVLIVVEKPVDGEVKYGLRVADLERGYNTIVPLSQCPSIPRQSDLASKKIVEGLSNAGFAPFCPATDEGELLGFALRISDLGKFVLTVILRRPDMPPFYEFNKDGLILKEGEEAATPYTDVMDKKKLEANSKLNTFFDSSGKGMGIVSIFLSWSPDYNITCLKTSRVWNHLPKPDFVCGNELVIDKLNGVLVKLPWDRERHTEVHKTVLPLFDSSCFTNTSTIYLMCPFLDVGFYLAKQCSKVVQAYYWTRDNVQKNADFAKRIGAKNISYSSFHALGRRPQPPGDSLMVWWPYLNTTSPKKNSRVTFVKKFMGLNYMNHVFISYWTHKEDNLLPFQQTQMESIYTDMKVTKIIPFDLEPYREGFGLYVQCRGAVEKKPEYVKPGMTRGGAKGRLGGPIRNSAPVGKAPFNKGPERGGFGGDRRGGGGGRGGFRGNVWGGIERGGGPGGRGGDDMRREVRTAARPSVHQRLGPRQPAFTNRGGGSGGYGDSYSDPWNQGPSSEGSFSQLERVAGVVHNIQSMAQQMQAYFQQRQAEPPQSFKRKYDDMEREQFYGGGSGGGGGAGGEDGWSRRGSERWGGDSRPPLGGGGGGAPGGGPPFRGGERGGFEERMPPPPAARNSDSWASDSMRSSNDSFSRSSEFRDYNHQDTKRRREDFSDRGNNWGGRGGGGPDPNPSWGQGQEIRSPWASDPPSYSSLQQGGGSGGQSAPWGGGASAGRPIPPRNYEQGSVNRKGFY